MKEKVIVTGGAGFIGSHLSNSLSEKGFEVHVVDNLSSPNSKVKGQMVLHQVDIRNFKDLEGVFEITSPIKMVFHLAALPSVPYSIENPIETNDVNVGGLLNVLKLSKKYNAGGVIFSSSSAVYGDTLNIPTQETTACSPSSPYGLQKFCGEQYAVIFHNLYGLPATSLRYFNVYGPGSSINGAYSQVIARFIALRRKGKPLTIVGDGRQTRDYVHVEDVVSANLKAMDNITSISGMCLNIGTGKEVSINDIAKIIGGKTTRAPERQEISRSCADYSLARKKLGWIPKITFSKGVEKMLKEF